MNAFGWLHQPLAEGKDVVVRQGLDAQPPEANLRFEEYEVRMRLSKSGEWQKATKPNAIMGLGSKRDRRAEKVNVLTL